METKAQGEFQDGAFQLGESGGKDKAKRFAIAECVLTLRIVGPEGEKRSQRSLHPELASHIWLGEICLVNVPVAIAEDTGLEVVDVRLDEAFAARRMHYHDPAAQMESMRRIAQAFVEKPETILQELVGAAVQLCGADSAGISIVKDDQTEQEYFHWVATAGRYSEFLGATLPRYPSACSICLQRGRPQHFRVSQRFFDLLGIQAPTVTDGILLPWQVDETRGTIFIMAHGRSEAFDQDDSSLMEVLADFAAMGVRQQKQQRTLLEQASATAAAAMANDLAHQINNPLQSLTNILYLSAQGQTGEDAKAQGRLALEELQRLSALVKKLLALPYRS